MPTQNSEDLFPVCASFLWAWMGLPFVARPQRPSFCVSSLASRLEKVFVFYVFPIQAVQHGTLVGAKGVKLEVSDFMLSEGGMRWRRERWQGSETVGKIHIPVSLVTEIRALKSPLHLAAGLETKDDLLYRLGAIEGRGVARTSIDDVVRLGARSRDKGTLGIAEEAYVTSEEYHVATIRTIGTSGG